MRISRKDSRQAALLCLATVFAYLVSYSILTLRGDWYYSQSGELRYEFGLSVSDIVEWRPAGLWWQRKFKNIHGDYGSRGNTLGYVYSPLIALDRAIWHRTKTVLNESDFGSETENTEATASQPSSSELPTE